MRHYTPRSLPLEIAAQIVRDMAEAYAVPVDVTPHAERIAAACRNHPRLIEWAIKLLRKRGLNDVLAEFEGMKGKKLDEALDDILHRTLRQMTAEVGPEPEAALRKLAVFRGGFTRAAAEAVLGDEFGNLSDALDTLQSWPFVTIGHQKDGSVRYNVDPLAIEVLDEGLDEAIHAAHYNYYKALAKNHDEHQDYVGLDPDSDNLETAFEWAMGASRFADAYWLREACSPFQENRGRFAQRMDWIERVASVLIDTSDDFLSGAVQDSLGTVYKNHPFGNRRANLHRAVSAYTDSLHIRAADKASVNYAGTQLNLGGAYRQLAANEDTATNLRRAIDAYTEALRFFIPEVTPLFYATCQNNLGNAYGDLAEIEDITANLGRAITAYTEALRFRTPETAPLGYAQTQYNLGNIYQNLAAIEDKPDNWVRAIAAYQEALRFYTFDTAPLDYASTQNNLGAAYRNLAAIEEQDANLQRAITAYTEALRFRTPDAAPLRYAETQNNLGIAYEDSGDLPAAIAAWRESERVYRQMGYGERADMLLGWIAEAEAQLDEEGGGEPE